MRKWAALFTVALLAGTGFAALKVFDRRGDIKLIEQLLPERFEDGDLVLFRSATWRSIFVNFLQWDRESYTHIGIAHVGEEGVSILHSDPRHFDDNGRDGVRYDRLEALIDRYSITSIKVLRVSPDVYSAQHATENAFEILKSDAGFDHEFDMASSETIYCTEFVYYAYGGQSGPFSKVAFSSTYFFPMDVAKIDGIASVDVMNGASSPNNAHIVAVY